jgi:hypothetical protein
MYLFKTFFISILIMGSNIFAQDFEPNKTEPVKISCAAQKNKINFAGNKLPYKLYDKSIGMVKALKCEIIKLNGLTFYSALISAEITELNVKQKVLLYELAVENKQGLKTVRSEIVDQIDLASGDLANPNFELGLQSVWGLDKKDSSILLKIDILEKNQMSEPYYLKYNVKNQWFENVFKKNK